MRINPKNLLAMASVAAMALGGAGVAQARGGADDAVKGHHHHHHAHAARHHHGVDDNGVDVQPHF